MASAVAARAAAPRLTDVRAVTRGQVTTVTVRAGGGFTHKEYRPEEDLLLIDLVGVAAGELGGRNVASPAPGIHYCRVIGYTASGGAPVSRLELRLAARAQAQVTSDADGLTISVAPAPHGQRPAASAKAIAGAAAAASPAPAPKVPLSADQRPTPSVQVRDVEVTRNDTGVDVGVLANGPLRARTFRLSHPDRIVVDLPDTAPEAGSRTLPVHSFGVAAVRWGCFRREPPVTRLVIDLMADCDFDLVNRDGTLVIKTRPTGTANSPAPAPAAAPPAKLTPQRETQPVVDATESSPASGPARNAGPAAAGLSQAKGDAGAPVANGTTEILGPEAQREDESYRLPAGNPSAAGRISDWRPADGAPEYKGAAQTAQDLVVVQPTIQEHVSNQKPDDATPATEPPLSAPNQPPARPAAPETKDDPAPATAGSAKSDPAPATAGDARPPATAATPPSHPVNFAADQQVQQSQPAPEEKSHYTGEPISVNLKDVDLKDFFRLIHEISGLNVVLDPTVGGSLTLVLDNVPWDQALDIVLRNNGLDRQLDGTVLRIATRETLRLEADARRHQVEAQMLAADKTTATRFLSYAHAKDVMPTVKRLLSPRGEVVADERTNALIISDVPSVIAPIDGLLAKLDRKTMEVEIEARVVAATRSFARDLGTQFGFGTGNNVFAVGGANSVATSPLIANNPTNPAYFIVPGTSSIPLFSNLPAAAPTSGFSFINATNAYRIDVILTAAEQRGLLKVLSRPRVVTQSNIQAVVKQGQRIPITTLGQLGGPPTVSYVEAVLRLTVTPQITVENTIFLNVDIENTTPDFSNEIQGNPVFFTQQATTQVLVTNGGTVVIGGVIQAQNSLNLQQVPLLGSVPVLGNLFKRRAVSTSTQELIFFITPKIVET
jgi:type IV pilus assembly protein PilQ